MNFNTKNYNYNFIRFIAALMVIISHSFALSLGASSQHYIDSHHLNLININTWGFLAVAVSSLVQVSILRNHVSAMKAFWFSY